MGAKSRNANQMEMFDGRAVEKYQSQFRGGFSTEECNAEDWSMDDHVCLLVIASVGESVLKKNNEDEVIRGNKLDLLRVVELEAVVADYALAKQAANAGSPMLPNFADPDDDDYDDHRIQTEDDSELETL